MRTYIEAGVVAALLLFSWFTYVKGGEHTRTAMVAEQAKRIEVAQEAIDLRDVKASEAPAAMLDYLRVTLPPIEIKTHEAIERTRVVYRTAPAPPAGVCERPALVRAELNAARERANAAVSRLRRAAAVHGSADPGSVHAGIGRVVAIADGPVRDGSGSRQRVQRLPAQAAG